MSPQENVSKIIANGKLALHQKSATRSLARIDNLRTQEVHLLMAIEDEVEALEIAEHAVRRAKSYVPAIGQHHLCPVCWIEHGRESLLNLDHGIDTSFHCDQCNCGDGEMSGTYEGESK